MLRSKQLLFKLTYDHQHIAKFGLMREANEECEHNECDFHGDWPSADSVIAVNRKGRKHSLILHIDHLNRFGDDDKRWKIQIYEFTRDDLIELNLMKKSSDLLSIKVVGVDGSRWFQNLKNHLNFRNILQCSEKVINFNLTKRRKLIELKLI